MLLKTLSLSFLFNVFGQRYPEHFGRENKQLHQPRQMLPKPKNDRYDTRALYDELDELDDRINRNNKWDEFKEMATQLKEKGQQNPDHDWHDDLRKVLEWSRTLTKDKPVYEEPIERLNSKSVAKPSAGMAPYWNEEYDQVQPKSRKLPLPGPNTPRFLTGKEAMKAALRNLEELNVDGVNIQKEDMNKKILAENVKREQNLFPKEDDFKAPIRWVPLESPDTQDGLAKVTDPKTGRNLNFVINGTLMVPIIDYSLERLGLTTTTSLPLLITDGTALRTVIRSVDLKKADEADWLVFETALGSRNDSNECKRLGCESTCNGDTCAAGCVAGHCSTFCKGPGCFAMCIGEGCSAKCFGISCEARCLGGGCEAGCRSFSCLYVVNGNRNLGGGTWGEHYPQYDAANIRPDY
ncbi:uncharacterized protein LOC126778509 isoform X2 [Nymphalis io]|uniref:uncharacterized protein LOC126778509 isoform X2 n=1 Tax=Inachis io TaxID=171585 RepID=UPI002169F494|nr:uncharacterized protein LOC126778509 isoform X2 [Nymphalis io]